MGVESEGESVVKATLKERIGGVPGYRTFVRVMVRRKADGFTAEPLRLQRSSVLMSMVAANGIVTIPEGIASFDAGQVVDVSIIGSLTS
jgi:molybdopterin biosynthesis enzyme